MDIFRLGNTVRLFKVYNIGGELYFHSADTKSTKSETGFNLGGSINPTEKFHFIFSFGRTFTRDNIYNSYIGLLWTIWVQKWIPSHFFQLSLLHSTGAYLTKSTRLTDFPDWTWLGSYYCGWWKYGRYLFTDSPYLQSYNKIKYLRKAHDGEVGQRIQELMHLPVSLFHFWILTTSINPTIYNQGKRSDARSFNQIFIWRCKDYRESICSRQVWL